MARLTYNERFTSVNKYNEDGSYNGLQVASKLNQKNGQDYKLIDSIDIDWNGVWSTAAQAYIYDTYQLFETIDNIADLTELEWVKNKINELTEDVDLIMSTYVTQEQLAELLSHYEHALEAGDHIKIDDNNVISTYDLLTPEEANDTFATITSLEDFKTFIFENYYDLYTTESVANRIAYANIQDYVIKNADERYNDLEKISYWILQQPEDITGGLEEIKARVNRLDEVVGYSIYDEDTGLYTYTGMIKDIDDIFTVQEELIQTTNEALETSNRALSISLTAIDTANTAYEFAYIAYEVALDSGYMALEAYTMAYYSVTAVGHKHELAYYTELTDLDIAILTENPKAFDVYAIRPDNLSGIPILEYQYDPEYEGQYYKYIPETESTGFYRDLENLEVLAYDAKYSADNALFRLYAQTEGTSYMNLNLLPEENDGSNIRILKLDVDEAQIDSYSGEVLHEGIITNSSLTDTLSYISTFVIIPSGDN